MSTLSVQPQISDQEIGPLLKAHPNLTSLDISYCTQLTAVGIQTIALSLWDKKLISLTIKHCQNPKILPADWIQFIQLINFSNMKMFDLTNVCCDFESEEPIREFANIRPKSLVQAKIKSRLIS